MWQSCRVSGLEPAWKTRQRARPHPAERHPCPRGRRRGHVSRERGGVGLGAAHCAITARATGSVVWGQIHSCALAVSNPLGLRPCRICTAAFVRAMLAGGTQPGVWFPEQREAVPDRRALLQARALPWLYFPLAGEGHGGEAAALQQPALGLSCLVRGCRQYAGILMHIGCVLLVCEQEPAGTGDIGRHRDGDSGLGARESYVRRQSARGRWSAGTVTASCSTACITHVGM